MSYEDDLALALIDWDVEPEEENTFAAGFEAGYLAGIDRGMEVEHELATELQVQHDPSLDV